jgi:UDP-glucose 4-epimerase
MTTKRVLVAGGIGFVGSHVAQAFVAAGWEVRSLARRTPSEKLPGVEYRIGDLAIAGDVVDAMTDVTSAVFAATETTPGSAARDALHDLTANAANALNFLEAARAGGLAGVVLVSSGGTVYGAPRHIPVTESHPTEPISVYGVTRLAVEKYFGAFSHDAAIPVAVLRAGNAVGPRQPAGSGQGAAAAFLHGLLTETPIEVWGDGSVVRDYVDAADIGRACVLAAARQLNEPAADAPLVLNIGSGRGTSLLELLELCMDVTKRSAEIVWRPSRSFDIAEIVLDVSEAASVLGWTPEVQLEESLRRQSEWLAGALPASGRAG